MLLCNLMDNARLEQGYPPLDIDWNRYIEQYTNSSDKCLFSTDNGFIAGLKTSDYMLMSGVPIAIEIAWYVDKDHRNSGLGMALYNLFEAWADDCEYILQGRPTKGCFKVGNLYMRKR